MSRKVLFRPEAEEELGEAVQWYEARGKGLGAAFLRALEATISAIARQPDMFPMVADPARRAVLRRFPYSVIYTVSDEEILVLACFHGRRDPKRWQERV